MIVPMTRYQFLLYHADLQPFLERLREIGLVDITTTTWEGDDNQRQLFDQSELYKQVAHAMRSIKITPDQAAQQKYDTPQAAVAAWDEATARITSLQNAIDRARVEEQQLEIWGNFDIKLIETLAQSGTTLKFFESSNKDFRSEWADQYPLEVVNRTKADTYFVVVQKAGDSPYVDIPATEVRAPQMSVEDKQAQIERYIVDQTQAHQTRIKAANSKEQIEEAQRQYAQQLQFNEAMNAGETYADGTVRLLEGWAEAANIAKIEAFADKEEVVYTSEKARAEQNPPVKLKNNFFARLYEPIGSLYMLPRYGELDLTPYFAPFFMIFFGMCLGDAAYGLLYIAAILVLWRKVPRKYKDFLWLGLFLSTSGIVFGLLSGNFGGIEIFKIEALANLKKYMVLSDPDTTFYFAVALGGVQVLFGQILRIFNRAKRGGSFVYGLSSLGWVILFISSIVAYTTDQTAALWYYISLGVAGFLILFFARPGKPFISFGLGLYSAYEMATGVVGDLISYVRLFAIGLAGAIIAQVFNELAMGLSGDIIVVKQIVMLLILVIGHGLNIFLSSLSAFVHPVRLTFVEFFKNAEFEGGGRAFDPLKRVVKED